MQSIRELAAVFPSSSITFLNMARVNLSTPGLRTLCEALPKMSQLQLLDLSENYCGDLVTDLFVPILPCLPLLSDLGLNYCSITTAGAQTLATLFLKCSSASSSLHHVGLLGLCKSVPVKPSVLFQEVAEIFKLVLQQDKMWIDFLTPSGSEPDAS
jgi:hypothetical protein